MLKERIATELFYRLISKLSQSKVFDTVLSTNLSLNFVREIWKGLWIDFLINLSSGLKTRLSTNLLIGFWTDLMIFARSSVF